MSSSLAYFNGVHVAIVLILIGLYSFIAKRNIIKLIIGLNIFNTGVILFFTSIGYVEGGTAPIIENFIGPMVDPIPQALMLTAIVIGLSETALALSLSVRIYEKYRTLDVRKLRRKMKNDE